MFSNFIIYAFEAVKTRRLVFLYPPVISILVDLITCKLSEWAFITGEKCEITYFDRNVTESQGGVQSHSCSNS